MSRPSLVVAVVVLLAATATVAAVGPASLGAAPVVNATSGGPNHLAINESDVAASNTTTASLDVGVAIAADSAALRAEYIDSSFQRAMANAEVKENRTRIRLRTLERIENASEALRERNHEAIEAFATGDLSAAEFLVNRARITTRAEELHQVVLTIHDGLPYKPPEDVTHRVNYLRGQLRAMQGPISTAAANQVIHGADATMIYVEASDTGYTLAQITDGSYERETFLGSEWRPELEDRFATNPEGPLDAAKNRSATLYPWVIENKEAGGGMFGDGIYWTSWELPGGKLRIYLDGGTTNVFREFQARALVSFNRTEVINRTSESVRITVDRTYETGPAAVTLRDAETGNAINGTVAIGGRDPVPVGPDGTHWFVEPRNDVAINATAYGTDLSVTLSGS